MTNRCKHCKKDFIVKHGCKGVFCSMLCKGEYQKHSMLGTGNSFFGRKHSKETIDLRTKKVKGMFLGKKNPFYGKKHTEETILRMRFAKLGKKASLETRLKQGISHKGKNIWRKGMVDSVETRKKKSEALKGANGPNWRGGINPINDSIRKSLEMKLASQECLKRDNYTCQKCGVRGGYLNSHHIKSFAYYPELRFNLENLITLCVDCHKKTESYLRKIKINGE